MGGNEVDGSWVPRGGSPVLWRWKCGGEDQCYVVLMQWAVSSVVVRVVFQLCWVVGQ